MIELNETQDGLVRVRVAGQIDQSEYQANRPRIEGIIAAATAPLRLVIEIAADAEVEPTVLWDDMQFGEANAHHFGRVAVVAPARWQAYVELVAENGVTAKLFAPGDAATAEAWVKGA